MRRQNDRFNPAWPIAAVSYGVLFSIIEAFGRYSENGLIIIFLWLSIGVILLPFILTSILLNIYTLRHRRSIAAAISPVLAFVLMPAVWSHADVAAHLRLYFEWPGFEIDLVSQWGKTGHRYLAKPLGVTAWNGGETQYRLVFDETDEELHSYDVQNATPGIGRNTAVERIHGHFFLVTESLY